MGKGTNFSGQPIFTQLLNLLDKSKISKASKALVADKYVKRFTSHKHIVVMLFVAFEGYNSIRETVLGLLSNAHRLGHLGLDYGAYYDTYRRYSGSLADSSLSKQDLKRLYIMDSTTITLFKNILKGVGRNPDNGKKKGGIKAHTIIRSEDNQPCFIRYTEAAKHDHLLLKEVNLPEDSILCFDRGYVDYSQYEAFTLKRIWYVTRLKDNALYQARKEFDIPDDADSGVLKDEQIELSYGKNKSERHLSRRIAYWDSTNGRLFEFITNNMELPAEVIAQIYKKRWQIEFFKQLKQNFPLKYFQGDNENAIIIQIWAVMLANLLLMILKSQIKAEMGIFKHGFCHQAALDELYRCQKFFENPEKAWQELIEEQKARQNDMTDQYSLFPQWEGAYF